MSCRKCGFIDLLPLEPPLQDTKAIHSSDSLVSQILRGSRPLLDSDHALLDSEIVKLEQLHSLYDAQFQEIQLQRRAVLEALGNRKSIYAPIRRLPRDILIEIFHLVCDSWWKRPNRAPIFAIARANSLDLSGPLWALCRVCGLWRDTLHTSPASWARNVAIKSPFSKHASEILQTYLERTGQHLLNLRVFFDKVLRERGDEIMSLLVQSCQRWKSLDITARKHHMHHLESISHFPALQMIYINVDDDGDPDYHSNICVAAPHLRQAIVYGPGIHQMGLPPRITHYTGIITCLEDLHLLSQLPNLRTSDLRMWEAIELAPPVVMAQLRHLCVDDVGILDVLIAPLSGFTVNDTAGWDWPSSAQEYVTRFLHRSRCHLESLSVCESVLYPESSATINGILASEACSTISRLKLELSSPVINVTEDFASSSFPPNLRHLVLCVSQLSENDWSAILHVVRSRRDAGVLKLVEVQFKNDQYADYMEKDIQALTVDDFEMRIGKWDRW